MRTEKVPLNKVKTFKGQPREDYEQEKLKELAESIREHGLLQLPKAREVDNGDDKEYEIVYGNRRLEAAKLAGLQKIPLRIEEVSDEDAQIQNLIENIEREDLDTSEKYDALVKIAKKEDLWGKEEGITNPNELARRIGQSRRTVRRIVHEMKVRKKIGHVPQEEISQRNIDQVKLLDSIEDKTAVVERATKEGWGKNKTKELANAVKQANEGNNPKVKKHLLSGDLEVESAEQILSVDDKDEQHRLLETALDIGTESLQVDAVKMNKLLKDDKGLKAKGVEKIEDWNDFAIRTSKKSAELSQDFQMLPGGMGQVSKNNLRSLVESMGMLRESFRDAFKKAKKQGDF